MIALKDKICEVARKAGNIMLNADRGALDVESKEGQANFVTKYDVMVQEFLNDKLLEIVPDAHFIGEEGDWDDSAESGKSFIVDPIDGTTNFIKDYHMSCVSIAYLENEEVQIGVIYNPYLDEMYWAVRNQGAFCNNTKLHVSEQSLENGIVLFGAAPYYRELWEKSFKMVYKYFEKALDIRRSGSAALDLCAIAAGRAELYFELRIQPWDFAAGSLLVEEAGGIVTDVDGNKLSFNKPCAVVAHNGKCL